MQDETMPRGLDRASAKRDRHGGSLLSSPYYESDNDSSAGGERGCLGVWITSLLGGIGSGGGEEHGRPGVARATDDDPTLLVAQELNQLSIQEREVVYEDLHGVSMVVDESNLELVNHRLNLMNAELEKIPREKKAAYLVAQEECGQQGKDFCADQSLHKMFLRADRWDAQKAAARFVAWMDWKLELFGRNVLCLRHITLDVLDKDGQELVQSGRMQILPQRDTSGRTVIFDLQSHQSQFFRSVKGQLQMFWYIAMATVEDDVQAQRTGIVYILYCVGNPVSRTASDRKIAWDAARMGSALPIRTGGVHYCVNDPTFNPLIAMIQTAIGSYIRARFRSHQGTHTEVQYSLMTFGMPADVLPMTSDGKLKLLNHSKWCKRRIIRDKALANQRKLGDGGFQGIDLPGRYDVLLGKGKPIQESQGNRRLHELVRIYLQEYLNACHGDKQLIAEKVVFIVQDPSNPVSLSLMGGGGVAAFAGAPRFLKRRHDGWWEIVSHDVAIDKVCHTFRAARVALEVAAAASSSGNTKTSQTTTANIKGDWIGSATGDKRAKVVT
jgi:hypothetical protein